MISVKICGTGAVLPTRVVNSTELDKYLKRSAGWVEKKFLIRERRFASGDETSSLLGARAAELAFTMAGWAVETIDVIVGACGVMEQPIPSTACLIQRHLRLGGGGIPAFDVNATCLSFLVALDHVCLGFAAGRWRRAIIVSADIASAALDFSTPEASVIFGDGAAAVALEADSGSSGILASRLETFGDDADLCALAAGGTRLRPHEDIEGFLAQAYFRMDGRGTFLAAARRLPSFLEHLLCDAGIVAQNIDLVIPHQASAAALDHFRRVFPHARKGVVDIFADHGNQMAASLPSALHAAIASGRLRRGDTALLIGSAAGLSLGGAVLRY